MKRVVFFGAMIFIMAFVSGCSFFAFSDRIRYDEAAVLINEYAGTNSGVQENELPSGSRVWKLPGRYVVKFPTTLQTHKFEQPCRFVSNDKVTVTLPMTVNVLIKPAMADDIVRYYRGAITKSNDSDDYALDDIISGPMFQKINNACIYLGSKYTSDQLYADGGRAMVQAIMAEVSPEFSQRGIMIQQLMPASPPGLPAEIVNSLQGALMAQTEARRKEAELAATLAEGKKTVAKAEADARARELAARSIRENPEVLKLEELKVHKGICPLNTKVCVVGASAPTIVESVN